MVVYELACPTKLKQSQIESAADAIIYSSIWKWFVVFQVELVSKELNHLAAILHVHAGGLNFMK